MAKWYQENYVNRRDWILENLEYLKITPLELEVILLIDYFNSNHQLVSPEVLAEKTNLDITTIDDVFNSLESKNYLEFKVSNKGVIFSLDKLFEIKIGKEEVVFNVELFNLFEEEFGKPLSKNDMEKLNQLRKKYTTKLIIYALREASLHNKLTMQYITAILREWDKNGENVSKLENRINYGS